MLVGGIGVAYLAASVLLAVLSARDMDRRGHHGEVYGVVTLFVLPLGLAMWALDRRRTPPTP
jgi:hypothetical protein